MLKTGNPGPSGKHLLWIGLAALLVRLAALFVLGEGCFLQNAVCPPPGDQREYLGLAENLLAGKGFTYDFGFSEAGKAYFYRPPAYPAFLAVSLGLSGGNYLIVRVLQVVATVLMAVAAYLLAFAWLAPPWPLAAGLLCAFSPYLFYFSLFFLSDFQFQVLSVAGFFFFFRAVAKDSPRNAAAFGFCMALAALTRGEAFYLGLFLIAALSLKSLQHAKWRTSAMAALLCFALPTGLWMTRNALAGGGFALQSKILGLNLLRSYNPNITGIPWPAFQAMQAELAPQIAGQGAVVFDSVVTHRFMRLAAQEPLMFLKITARQAIGIWKIFPAQRDPLTGQLIYQAGFYRWLSLLFYGLWLPFFFVGFAGFFRRCRFEATAIAGLFGLTTLMVALVNDAIRHRIVLMPLFYLLAVWGLGATVSFFTAGPKPAKTAV